MPSLLAGGVAVFLYRLLLAPSRESGCFCRLFTRNIATKCLGLEPVEDNEDTVASWTKLACDAILDDRDVSKG